MTRLLLVTHYYPDHRSGIELVAGHLAGRLAGRGYAISWAASNVTPGAGTTGCSLLPMPAWNQSEARFGVPYPLWSPAGLRRLAAAVRATDVVHIHDALYFGNAAAWWFARRYDKPVVITQHIGAIPYKSPLLRGALWTANHSIGRTVLGRADRVVFIAPRVRDYFRQFVHFRTEPAFIPNGVDGNLFRPPIDSSDRATDRATAGLPTDRRVMLFVGRFVEKKGLGVLRHVAERLPECLFVFVGWGPIDPTHWRLANVRVVGSLPAEKLPALYQAADLLVLPSVGEGFPLVVQEAMACGTPAIISDETAAGYPGANTWALPTPPTPEAITSAIRSLLSDPAGLAVRRAQVAAFAAAEWSWDRCAEAYDEVFRDATASHPTRPRSRDKSMMPIRNDRNTVSTPSMKSVPAKIQ